jgi:hypothetical protein
MTVSIQEIRKKLQEMEDKKKPNNSKGGPSASFPFWNMEFDTSTRVRFLPDKDVENPYFWREKQVINLPFPGIKGTDETKEITVQVPCVDMYKPKSCPIVQETAPWWNDDDLVPQARKYWKKRTFYFQGFVIDSELSEQEVPENPIRLFSFTNKLYNIVKQSILDPEFDSDPFDYESGTDFIIKKTRNGQWADYTTSTWARKETPLTEEQLAAIETHGLFDLSTNIPREPTPETLAVIFEMFEASVNGEFYDPERWAQYYRPWGMEYKPSGDSTIVPPKTNATPSADETPSDDNDDDLPEPEDNSSSVSEPEEKKSKSAEDILAMIRNR